MPFAGSWSQPLVLGYPLEGLFCVIHAPCLAVLDHKVNHALAAQWSCEEAGVDLRVIRVMEADFHDWLLGRDS